MATLKRGMDHELYPYSALPSRSPLRWPQGQPLALCVVLYLDYWELETPKGQHRAPGAHGPWGNQFPDLRTWSYRLYGERIGLFRILEVLKRHGVRATIAAGAEFCRQYPELIKTCADQGYEIAAHGTHATRMITSRMTEAEERAVIQDARTAIAKAAGHEPSGWFGQDQGESTRTPNLVSEAGFSYIADWPNDEQPYWMTVERPLVSIPLQTELDDQHLLWMRQHPVWHYPDLVEQAANQLAVDGREQARSLCLGVRTWLFGRPHRIKYLDEALSRLSQRDDIWVTTAADIAQAFQNQFPAQERPTP